MPNEKQLVIETPAMHNSQRMQSFISQEISRPCKQWIHQVILAKRETERIKLRTEQFVLLPDVECINKGQYIKALEDKFAPNEKNESMNPISNQVQCPTVQAVQAVQTVQTVQTIQKQPHNPRRANQLCTPPFTGFRRFNQGIHVSTHQNREQEHTPRMNPRWERRAYDDAPINFSIQFDDIKTSTDSLHNPTGSHRAPMENEARRARIPLACSGHRPCTAHTQGLAGAKHPDARQITGRVLQDDPRRDRHPP